MSVFKPKSRLVSFRLSEDEYDGLKNTCIILGVRSISDFARVAVSSAIGERLKTPPNSLETKVMKLDESVGQLNGEVQQLRGLVESMIGRAEAKAAV